MPFLLHRAPRADVLAEGLADLLSTPLPDPFAQELVIVPARGVERWLSQRLSHRLGVGVGDDGVCAGVDFRSPRSLVAELTGTVDDDPWAPDALVWPLLATIDAHLDDPWCGTLARHLGHGVADAEEAELRRGRRYAVARRLARLFASYAEQRPTLLADWESGRETDGAGQDLDPDLSWQPELWRQLVSTVSLSSPGRRHEQALDALRSGRDELPARLSLFGHTRIPRTEVELLAALGERHDVHLWLPHPSPPEWDALSGLTGTVPRDEDPSHTFVHHPLLASLGRDQRELERVLAPVVTDAPSAAPADEPTTLLGHLQADLAANAVPAVPRELVPDDSTQVHACHGPARQVEVLREVVLGLLEDHPTLEPRDVIVMCPDIETYAPLIEASFGLGEAVAGGHPGQRLQVRLADRALTRTNPLLGVASRLLDLAGGRAEASAVLDLLHAEPVRRRFGFTDQDLETVLTWVEQAGVRWAYDAAHRTEYGLAGYVQNTWRFGLDRVLAGVTMSDDANGYVGPTLPLDDVGSTSIDLAGRLAEALDRLQRVTDRLSGSHPVGHWAGTLTDGIDQLTAVPPVDEWQRGQVRRELAALGGDVDATLRLPDVRALLEERLGGRPTRANFRTGTLTVCTMVPMRSVPHRVICLLGLDDGVFPRATGIDGDDVLARRPLTGERDPRSEDRQLLLDAVLAAREHLVITYSGANETTGRPRPPSVPLGELLDALDRTAVHAKATVVRHHPLQDFDRRNLAPSELRREGPFSFDPAALAGARAAAGDRTPVPRLAAVTLPARHRGDVGLADLVRFYRNPSRAFLRDRLDVALADEGEDVADRLPVALDKLQEWAVGSRLLGDLVRGRTPREARDVEWRRGVLPPGKLGWSLSETLAAQAEPVAQEFGRVTGGVPARAVDVDVDLGDGRRLQGTVTGVHGERLVVTTYSKLGARQWLEAWIPLLALVAGDPSTSWSAGSIGRGRGPGTDRVTFDGSLVAEEATDLLRTLVEVRDRGLDRPLPLPLKTGFALAAQGERQAEWAWKTDRFPGEDADPAHVAVWGAGTPFASLLAAGLGEAAQALWTPMLDRRAG